MMDSFEAEGCGHLSQDDKGQVNLQCLILSFSMYIYYLDPTTTREGLAVLFNGYNWQLASCNCVNLVID